MNLSKLQQFRELFRKYDLNLKSKCLLISGIPSRLTSAEAFNVLSVLGELHSYYIPMQENGRFTRNYMFATFTNLFDARFAKFRLDGGHHFKNQLHPLTVVAGKPKKPFVLFVGNICENVEEDTMRDALQAVCGPLEKFSFFERRYSVRGSFAFAKFNTFQQTIAAINNFRGSKIYGTQELPLIVGRAWDQNFIFY